MTMIFFPNAQLRYKINEWSDIRVAFSKGISRPDYTAIIPETYFAPGADAHAGNAQLKPDISTNYDIAGPCTTTRWVSLR